MRIPAWRGLGCYSLIVAPLTVIPALYNLWAVITAGQTPISNPSHAFQYGGLFNRAVVAIAFAWYLVIAIRLLRSEPPAWRKSAN